jgi:hypothetical protein
MLSFQQNATKTQHPYSESESDAGCAQSASDNSKIYCCHRRSLIKRASSISTNQNRSACFVEKPLFKEEEKD